MTREHWDTVEAIMAAKRRLIDRMPGWETPAAYGVTLVPGSSTDPADVHFPVVNVPVHELPSLVLALLTGRRGGSGTYELARSELEAAVALLAPAEAALMYNHPNLASWREIARDWAEDPAGRVFAVFIGDFADRVTSPYDLALRRQIESGQRSPEVFITGQR
ncbi:hypothetical protein ORV05_15635 [Amycolatopsis cynarae]|uniref:Uncharacterized protein n=1 Tax=Amycolatopsis cynarae TaxID=2995223 RepID=A0ABY7B9W1_9PSEU|nr:hypothetical protein [Amycolatopsis sp. HUAS 11-8]WAL69131.1 hypothetical protein ORV05_15635 [Amycolatopsis sp. HUAS 11-8]